MSRRPKPSLIASLLAVLCLGAGGGALLYAAFGPSQSKPAAQPVTVKDSQPASTTSPLSIPQIYRSAYKGVVQITVSTQGSSPFGGSQTQQAQGSGWVYDANGDIVTNAHVAAGAKSISVQFWNGKTYHATLVGADPSTDIAVVHVSAPDSQLFPLTVGDSSKLEVGDGVVAIGSPFGLSETVTSGIVSALHRSIEGLTHFTIPDSIQTDAAINHGNSGGPLLDTEGHVVGMNSQIRSDSGGNEGVGFAIPVNTIHSVVSQLISSRQGRARLPRRLALPDRRDRAHRWSAPRDAGREGGPEDRRRRHLARRHPGLDVGRARERDQPPTSPATA